MISISGGRRLVAVLAAGVVGVGGVVAIGTGGPSSQIVAGGGVSCDSTISSGGNVATALISVAAGGTVCLNAGTYTYNASVSKSAMTTVTAANGDNTSVTFSTFVTNTTSNVNFDRITISGDSEIGDGNFNDAGSSHLHLTNSRIIRPGSLCIQQASPSNADVLIDHVDFGNTNASTTGDTNCDGGEGRLDIKSTCTSCGFTVSNSTFGPGGDADGIQVHWGTDGVTIGPGNYFHDILEDTDCPTTHCDAIQPFGAHHITVTGNYFYTTSDGIQAPDCDAGNDPSPITVTNNVFYQDPGSATQEVVLSGLFGGTSANVIQHNTIVGPLRVYGGNTGCTNNPITVRDNVLVSTNVLANTTAGSLIDHNLVSTAGDPFNGGAGAIVGAPTFAGGATPTTFAGWALTAGSLGHNAASDGTDMGAPVATMTGAWP